MVDQSQPTVAVDFGTSTMLVAVRTGDEDPDLIIPIGDIEPWMPSLVGVADDGSCVYGEAAEQLHPDKVIRSIKTLLGDNVSTVTLAEQGVRRVDGLIQGLIEEALRRAKERAAPEIRRFLEPSSTVPIHLGCPANWTGEPRRRLGEIATQARLRVLPDEIVDEPIAAGISWCMGSQAAGQVFPEGQALVFDYGGGTLDVAVLGVTRREGASHPDISVLSASALSMAGDELDGRISRELKASLHNERWSDDQDEVEKDQLILKAARELKHALSDRDEHEVSVLGLSTPVCYTRQQLEVVFQDQLQRAMKFVFSEIRASVARQGEANIGTIRATSEERLAEEIDHFLLAGGMSRIPCVQVELENRLNAPALPHPHFDTPEMSVVAGLTFRDVVGRLNIHRPGFNFIAQYLNKRDTMINEQVLYEAFSPLYKPSEPVTQVADLGHRVVLEVPEGAVRVRVICRTVSDRAVPLVSGGQVMDDPTVEVSNRPVRIRRYRRHGNKPFFKLYVDGRIIISGKTVSKFAVERWPSLASGLAAELHVQPVESGSSWYSRANDPDSYHYNR